MKTIAPALKAALSDGKYAILYSIIAKDGTRHDLTSHDVNLAVDGRTFTPSAGLTRIKSKMTNSAEISNQQFAGVVIDLPDDELRSGKWDNAKIVSKLCSWQNPEAGSLTVFEGRIGLIQWNNQMFRADVHDDLRELGKNYGRNITAECPHQLFGVEGPGVIGACNVDKSAFTATGTVTAVLTNYFKFKVNVDKPDDWATGGQVKFTSGVLSGQTLDVKRHADGSIELYTRSIANPAVGASFELYAGCDKTLETCKSKFNNVVNFGGFPHLQVDVNARLEVG